MRTSRKRTRITLLVILLLFISMGYAFVSTGLKIDGIATIIKQTWDVHFENVKVKRGSVTPIHEATINVEDPTQVSYEVHLENPGDFYEFKVDVVNNGTIDAMVTEILSTNNNQPISLPSYMKYSVTYEDGREIKPNHLLKKKEGEVPTRERYKVGVYFKSDIDPSELVNSQPLNLRLKFEITYGQATKDAYERDITMFLTGKEVNVKMKELAGDTGATHNTIDTNITAIKHSVTEPTSENKQANNIVSTEDSTHEIYMWYDNGTIYWWSEDPHPSLNPDASNMFRDLRELINIDGLEDFDVTTVKSMQSLFSTAIKLPNFNKISNWDISNLENLRSTFTGCLSVTDLTPLENWDTSNVTTMYGTFMGHTTIGEMKINSLKPLKNWNTSKVENMMAIFQRNFALTSLEGLENWNISKVTNMQSGFGFNINLTDISALKNWDVSKVENTAGIFAGNTSLVNAEALKNWDTDNINNVQGMFQYCINLQTVDISSFKTAKITNSIDMFDGCTNLTTIYGNESFNTELNTTSTDMFKGCTSLVGGGPTPFDSTHTDKEYARVGNSTTPGYFTLKTN